MKKIHSYFFHGFNNDSDGWDIVFNNTVTGCFCDFIYFLPGLINENEFRIRNSSVPFDTNFIKWKSGELGNKFLLVVSAIISPDAVLNTHDKWNNSNSLAEYIGLKYAKAFNIMLGSNDFLLLSAHSLGSLIIYNIIENLNENIDVGIIVMGGTESANSYELLIEQFSNVKILFNFYNPDDTVLKDFLPEFSYHYDAMGICELTTDKGNVINVKTRFTHSGYKNYYMRLSFIYVANYIKNNFVDN